MNFLVELKARRTRLGCLLALATSGLILFRPHSAWVTVHSFPEGAQVYFQNHPCGVTPCRVKIGTRGPLRLDLPGYGSALEFVRLGSSPQELRVWLRPGIRTGNQPAPGDYPPLLGTPPEMWLRRPDGLFQGQSYRLPRGWNAQNQTDVLQLRCGDGIGQPRRQAQLKLLKGQTLHSVWEACEQRQAVQGFTTRAAQCGDNQAWWRGERSGNLSVQRSCLLWRQVPEGILELSYDYPDCIDLFGYTYDLDALRAGLGF